MAQIIHFYYGVLFAIKVISIRSPMGELCQRLQIKVRHAGQSTNRFHLSAYASKVHLNWITSAALHDCRVVVLTCYLHGRFQELSTTLCDHNYYNGNIS